jgi:DNA-directed RNA polymerase specialized sigma24 family protein
VEGHSIGELADFTGQSEAAIKTKIFRARRKLVKVAEQLSRRTSLAPACS